ncbi:hypothetical protein [Alkalilimnicola sp. S0819]|uniref:hypothetical protein n=1 Tax=Alkalilimnicola sp. S0819 TaxID=2613922 RepID=UPI001261452E|nr:hypothetical protein [Alkalilimnicola sp. S0819]KAB7624088.1 hypothetical protein F3N43_06775 [Alkalilimnicola sp. S0819]MPQ16338.1 hypothetical protein [Alkalilimnicola sp. S0819]
MAPGQILGRLALRSHVAEVDVHYDAESYSINLKYDGVDIHRNHNGLGQNLDRAINEQIHKL